MKTENWKQTYSDGHTYTDRISKKKTEKIIRLLRNNHYLFSKKQTNMKTIIGVIVGVLMADFVGFLAWIYSGQVPSGGFWLGRITFEILKSIIN